MLYSLISAGLYQLHDKDKGVAAYASKTLLPPEKTVKKALLCTVWAIQRFSNYIGVQKAGALHGESWTFHALPPQPFSGSSNPLSARHWRAHPCLLPHCPITSVCY